MDNKQIEKCVMDDRIVEEVCKLYKCDTIKK